MVINYKSLGTNVPRDLFIISYRPLDRYHANVLRVLFSHIPQNHNNLMGKLPNCKFRLIGV